MSGLTSPGFFRLWVGYGGILYATLALALAARAGSGWLAATVGLGAAWWWETSTGFCRRCTHFNCGPHGALMKRFFARDKRPLPRRRLLLHVAGDLVLFLWPQWWIWEWPWLGAASLIWLAGAAVAVIPVSGAAVADSAKYAG